MDDESSILIKIQELTAVIEPIEIMGMRFPDEENAMIQTEEEQELFDILRQELIDGGLIDLVDE